MNIKTIFQLGKTRILLVWGVIVIVWVLGFYPGYLLSFFWHAFNPSLIKWSHLDIPVPPDFFRYELENDNVLLLVWENGSQKASIKLVNKVISKEGVKKLIHSYKSQGYSTKMISDCEKFKRKCVQIISNSNSLASEVEYIKDVIFPELDIKVSFLGLRENQLHFDKFLASFGTINEENFIKLNKATRLPI